MILIIKSVIRILLLLNIHFKPIEGDLILVIGTKVLFSIITPDIGPQRNHPRTVSLLLVLSFPHY